MKRQITAETAAFFKKMLYEEEKGEATIEKYLRDLKKLQEFLGDRELSRENMILYKEHLQMCGKYKASSINSFLAAANCFCDVMGWPELKVKALKVQEGAFRPEECELTPEEYRRLVETAFKKGDERLALIIQTMGSTGIRVGELQYVTVESLEAGMADVSNKGKTRTILYPSGLQEVLKEYVVKRGLESGPVFCTKSGRPVDRSNIWTGMQGLCKDAGVDERKVHPHNLRHLFAQCFYEIKQDIAKLADVLGHSSIETTRIYIKSTWKEHKKQLEKMKLVVVTSLKREKKNARTVGMVYTT